MTKQINLFQPDEPEPISIFEEAQTYHAKVGCLLPNMKPEDAYPEITDFPTLTEKMANCSKCELRATCNRVVFGDGSSQAKLMLIGEGPGQDEDIKGIPFVGRAGQLLDKILEAAELNRQELYIANVVKCRPPNNRLPLPTEVKACRGYLEKQIELIKPSIIVCLGSMATQTVMDPKAKITKMRGTWMERNGIRMMATFHPAALLRNPAYKRPTWEDFKMIRDAYFKLKAEEE